MCFVGVNSFLSTCYSSIGLLVSGIYILRIGIKIIQNMG